MKPTKVMAQILSSEAGLSHIRFKIAKHKIRCGGCKYGDCKTFDELQAKYMEAIGKHNVLRKMACDQKFDEFLAERSNDFKDL